MGNERDQYAHLTEAVHDFVSGKSLIHADNYSLDGTVRDVPTNLYTFVSLFPDVVSENEGMFAVTNISSTQEGIAALSRLVKIKLPQRVKDLAIPNDPELTSAAELVAKLQGSPMVYVAFGKTLDCEDVALLFCLPGMTPEDALSQIQERARRKLTSLS